MSCGSSPGPFPGGGSLAEGGAAARTDRRREGSLDGGGGLLGDGAGGDRPARARGSGRGAGPDAVEVVVGAAGGRLVPLRVGVQRGAVAGPVGALAHRAGDGVGRGATRDGAAAGGGRGQA